MDGICIAFEKLMVDPDESVGDHALEKQPIALQLDIPMHRGNLPWSRTTNEVEYIASRNAFVLDQGFCLPIALGEDPSIPTLDRVVPIKIHVMQGSRRLFSFGYELDIDNLVWTPSVDKMWGSVTQSTSRGEVMANSQSLLNDLTEGPHHSYSDLVFTTFRPC